MNTPLIRSVEVKCSLTHAFDVFTNRVDLWWPTGHRRFPQSVLTLEPVTGGRFFERADDGTEARLGEVTVCEPPHRIVYTWCPGAVVGPTEVEVRFTDHKSHTLVEITHREGDSALGALWSERVQLFGRAWSTVLPAFAVLAETSTEQRGVEPSS